MNIRKIFFLAAFAAMAVTISPAQATAGPFFPRMANKINTYLGPKRITYLQRVERDGLKRTQQLVKKMKTSTNPRRPSKNPFKWLKNDRDLFMAALLTDKKTTARAAATTSVPGFILGLIADLVTGTPGMYTAIGTTTGATLGAVMERGLKLADVFVQGAHPNTVGRYFNLVVDEYDRAHR